MSLSVFLALFYGPRRECFYIDSKIQRCGSGPSQPGSVNLNECFVGPSCLDYAPDPSLDLDKGSGFDPMGDEDLEVPPFSDPDSSKV